MNAKAVVPGEEDRVARRTTAVTPQPSSGAARLLALQRTVGNRATSGLVTAASVQRDEVAVDLEQVTPAQQAELASRGIRLPGASAAAVDPRRNGDYVDLRVNAVGFGIYLGGYLVYCDGLPLPVFVPDSDVDFGLTVVDTPDAAVYPDRTEAARATPFGPPAPGHGPPVAFYRGAGGGLVAPTTFSPATTPRFAECALRARRELAEQVQHDLVVLAISLVAGMALNALLNRIARIGGGDPVPPRPPVLAESGEVFGARMAREMSAAGFRGNPYREFMQRMNALTRRLPPQEAADAIRVATREFTNGTQGTMPPVQIGDTLVVPSRAPIPNAPVMGVKADGTVIMGRAPRIEIVTHGPAGDLLFPPQVKIHGDIMWQ
jgi:hypothetical protein